MLKERKWVFCGQFKLWRAQVVEENFIRWAYKLDHVSISSRQITDIAFSILWTRQGGSYFALLGSLASFHYYFTLQ